MLVSSGESAPYKVLNHTVVFVLSCTVVSMQEHFFLTKTMLVKEVDTTHHSISPLAAISCFIGQKIDLPR